MFIDIVVVGVIVGWATGGKLGNLGVLPLRGMLWFILLGAVQLGMQFTQSPERQYLYTGLIMLASVVATGLLWVNKGLPGMRLIMLGLLLNVLVMGANSGRMPVSEWAAVKSGQVEHLPKLISGLSSRHVLLSGNTRLSFLGDIIPVPPPYPVARVVSIGDVVLAAGVIQLIAFGMKTRQQCLKIPGSQEEVNSHA